MIQPAAKPSQFCSQLSSQAGEYLVGTVTRTRANFLLEYPGAWGEKAYEESNLPEDIREFLNLQMKSMPDVKTLLIKQDRAARQDSIRFFVAVLGDVPRLYEYDLPDYQSISSLDLSGLIEGMPGETASLRNKPLFLVCTNGRRDVCCAKFGMPVYEELSRTMGDAVWQCSHVGGHRFAPNMLCFPHGLLYGRLGTENVSEIAQAYADGLLDVISYRGWLTYEPPAQAADFFLRRQTGELRLGYYRLLDVQALGDENWLVRFVENHRSREHRLEVKLTRDGTGVFDSCRLDKVAPRLKFDLIHYSII